MACTDLIFTCDLFLLVTNHTWCVGFEKISKDYIE